MMGGVTVTLPGGGGSVGTTTQTAVAPIAYATTAQGEPSNARPSRGGRGRRRQRPDRPGRGGRGVYDDESYTEDSGPDYLSAQVQVRGPMPHTPETTMPQGPSGDDVPMHFADPTQPDER